MKLHPIIKLKDSFNPVGYFKCKDEKRFLVPDEKVCNGIVDCLHGSDELLCDIPIIEYPGCKQIYQFTIICDGLKTKETNHNKTLKKVKYVKKWEMTGMNSFIRILNESNHLIYLSWRDLNVDSLQIGFNFSNLVYLSLINCSLTETSLMLNKQYKILQHLILERNKIQTLDFLNAMLGEGLLKLDISMSEHRI